MPVTKTTAKIKKAASSRGRGNSWKSIDQEVRKKDMSDASRKHFRTKALKRFVLAACGLIVGCVIAKFTLFDDRAPELLSKAGRSMPVEKIEIQSDGTLGYRWTIEYLGLEQEQMDLLTVDIQGMKDKLEQVPQIASAHIHREYPESSLFISIEERSPMARISAGTKTGEVLTLFVDAGGIVYEARNYESKLVRSLPFLGGVRLKRAEQGGFEKIEGLDDLSELLEEARTIAPHLYRSWNVVSMEKAPQIVVKSRQANQLVFEPNGFRRQLARLDYILDHQRGRLLNKMDRVDLTLGAQVPVRIGAFGN